MSWQHRPIGERLADVVRVPGLPHGELRTGSAFHPLPPSNNVSRRI